MGKSRKKPKSPVDWEKVRELRMRCYGARGSVELSPDETALLLAAIEEDSERYRELGDEAKEYHWAWLPNNPYRKDED